MMKDMRENTTRRVGQVKEVTSLANPIIKDIKALTQKRAGKRPAPSWRKA